MKLVLSILLTITLGIASSQENATLHEVDCNQLLLKFDDYPHQELTILLEKKIQEQTYKVVQKFGM